MRIVIGQINPVVGDIKGNLQMIFDVLADWRHRQPDIFVFPELCITGYPPRDLLERTWLVRSAGEAAQHLMRETESMNAGIVIGIPVPTGRSNGKGLFNSAVLIHGGKRLFQQNKRLLPVYDVFDEERYFDSGAGHGIAEFRSEKIGLSVCEDAWNDPALWHKPMYDHNPIDDLAKQGATLMINISASPYYVGKEKLRRQLIRNHAVKYAVPFVFVNQVGGNDELIFDGRSMLVESSGTISVEATAFQTATLLIDTRVSRLADPIGPTIYPGDDAAENMFQALTLGLKDYVRKCRFEKVLIGLSGGIDSALTAVLAVHALGPKNVTGVTMPGPFSSGGSVTDSLKLAETLNIDCHVINITDIYNTFLTSLEPYFRNTEFGTAEENIQARARGNLLMALSNKTGAMVLTTGNKSEVAVGYCTLYGDMSGGLSVLSDVPKTWVYKLARHINRSDEVIPCAILNKPPSAELRRNQTDQDTLPPYDILDAILGLYIDDGLSSNDIIERGYKADTVRWVTTTVDRNEYKRRQAAPGLKVTSKAFGAGRRMPVAARQNIF
jgi:NAD+ synthase (glutamine-hydrolysing)